MFFIRKAFLSIVLSFFFFCCVGQNIENQAFPKSTGDSCGLQWYNQLFIAPEILPSESDILQIDKSIETLQKLQPNNRNTLSKYLFVKANYLSANWLFDESNKLSKEVVRIYTDPIHQIEKDTAFYLAYNLLVFNSMKQVDYTFAILYSEKAQQVAYDLNMFLEVAQEYDSQCQAYAISNKFDAALKAYEKGISMLDTMTSNITDITDIRQRLNSSMALVYSQRAEKLFITGRITKANQYYRKAADLLTEIIQQKEKTGTADPLLLIAPQYANLGTCYYRLSLENISLRDSAIYFYQQAVDIYDADTRGFSTHPENGILKAFLGVSLIHKKPIKAEELIQLGLKYTRYYSTTNIQDQITMFEKAPVQDRLIGALSAYAASFISTYRKTKEVSKLHESLILSREAIAHVEYLALNQLSNEVISTKRSLHDFTFLNGIEAAALLYKETEEFVYFEEAFSIMEKRKSFILRQGIKSRYTRLRDGHSKKSSLLAREIELDKRYRSLQGQKASATTLTQRDSLIDLLRIHLAHKQEFIDQLKGSTDKTKLSFYKDRYDNYIPDIATVRDKYLHKNSALVSYSFSGVNPLAIVITKDTQFVVRISLDEKFWKNFDRLIQCQRVECATDEYASAGFDVYEHIFKDIKMQLSENINELLIVPDNELRKLSFDYLLTNEVAEIKESKLPFLLQQYATGFAYSISTLEWINQLKESRPKKKRKRIAAFIASPNQPGYPMNSCSATILPYLEKSAKKVLTLFPEKEQALFKSATTSDFIEHAKDVDIVHIVAHGCIEQENAMDDYLQFFPDKDDDNEGRLTRKRIHDTFETNASLVVFASCKTKSGELEGGEGLASICRTFVKAGAEQVLVTLNDVNDYTSGELLLLFYEEMIVHEEKPIIALAKAKRRFLARPDIEDKYKSPNYWSNFVLIGGE